MNARALSDRLIPTIHEDGDLLAISKPAGLDVGDAELPEPGSLLGILRELRRPPSPLHPVNRLSRFESGLLLLGKSVAVARGLRSDLRAGRIRQEFQAVVLGSLKRNRVVVRPERSPSASDSSRRRKPGRSQPQPDHPHAERTAPTTVHLVRRGSRRALIRCETTVGTTHALRAQLRSIRARVLGDRLHDQPSSSARGPAGRRTTEQTCLHLARIEFRHPTHRRTVTLRAPAPPMFTAVTDGLPDVQRRLAAALVRRLVFLGSGQSDACRLLTGDVEGVAGLIAERYGGVAILLVFEQNARPIDSLRDIARWYRDHLGLEAVYVKRFVKDRSTVEPGVRDAMASARPIVGRPAPDRIQVIENGLGFWIRPSAGFSVGLFPDQRDNRARVRSMASGRSVLNLFAYTCSFSIAAAAGNASATTSVDLSSRFLEWGRENFALNGIEPSAHSFVQADALDFLRRAARRSDQVASNRFDLIVLDPPTFAHGRRRKKSFSVSRDLDALIAAALGVLNPGGVLMLSTNYRHMSLRDLRERVRAAARGGPGVTGRRVEVLEPSPLPVDYAMDHDQAKTIFARFE